jgi:hypothetical protein
MIASKFTSYLISNLLKESILNKFGFKKLFGYIVGLKEYQILLVEQEMIDFNKMC